MDEEDKAVLRAIAEMQVRGLLAIRETIFTGMLDAMKWIQASLLLINGAAAVAVLSLNEAPIEARVGAAAFYVAGIFCALLAAYVGFTALKDAPQKMLEAAGYWQTVTVDLLRSVEIEQEHLEYAATMPKRGRPGKWMGWAAAISFLIGCAIVGAGLMFSRETRVDTNNQPIRTEVSK